MEVVARELRQGAASQAKVSDSTEVLKDVTAAELEADPWGVLLRHAKPWLSEGVVLAACSALAYVCALTYEKMFMDCFSIPNDVAEVSIERVLGALGSILFAIIVGGIVCFLGTHPPVKSKIGRRGVEMLFAALLMGFPLMLYMNLKIALWGTGLLFGACLLLMGVSYLLRHQIRRLVVSIRWRTRAKERPEPNVEKPPETYSPPAVAVGLVVIAIGLLVVSAALASVAGALEARLKESFSVVKVGGAEYVVIRHYGDRIVLAALDRKTTKLTGEYKVVAPNNDLTFKREEIGYLAHGLLTDEDLEKLLK